MPFSYALELALAPLADVELPTQLVTVSAPGPGVLTFTGAAPSASRQDEMRAALRAFATGRTAFALDTVLGPAALTAASTALQALTGRQPGPMPASALVSARRIAVGTDVIGMLPCVAGFDLVSTVLPPQPSGPGCLTASVMMASLALLPVTRRLSRA